MTSTTRLRVGILICGHAPPELLGASGGYGHMFEKLLGEEAFTYSHYTVVDGLLPARPDEADGWLITGSRHGAYEEHPWIAPLEAFIRAAFNARVPLVGICFGHQIIAQALGGKVEKFADGWSVGRVTYQLDKCFGATDAPIHAFHQDQVVELPPGATPAGSSPFCRYAALAYDDRALTLQPHPEFDDNFVRGLLDTRGLQLPDEIYRGAHDSLGEPLASDRVGRALRDFLQAPRSRAADSDAGGYTGPPAGSEADT